MGVKIIGEKALVSRLQKMMNKKALISAVNVSGNELQSYAQTYAPVKTGNLRRSITTRLNTQGKDIQAIITSHAGYSGYLEWGTRRMSARPFMRPALNDEKDKFHARVRAAIK